jgi:hypothetical protein
VQRTATGAFSRKLSSSLPVNGGIWKTNFENLHPLTARGKSFLLKHCLNF